MGSLNGDVLVMRNGRSTSQVSVYNYPEHLNPFYEDDQHKRLRFWKINKKDNEGRRNSFSISNLKDMWAFKSFRTKKRSSTLGINKTSESPPTLRREFVVDNGWNTFDHRLRSNNTSSMNGDSFERNATYRSSLQTLPTNNVGIGLNRNDGYRSTIQVTRSNPRYQPQSKPQTTGVSQQQQRRYVYGGSVTPQPLRNTNVGKGTYEYDSDNNLIRGSSQSSMVSTNPFDTDNEDDNDDINSCGMQRINNGGSTSTLASQINRKKRRAPAPPTPIHGRSNGVVPPTIQIESSQDNTQDELRIREDMDIANLTAEIESFVKTKDNDDVVQTTDKDELTATTPIKSPPGVVEKVNKDKDKETTVVSTNKTVVTANNTTATVTNKEEVKSLPKTNGQVTTEIMTITTTISDTNKPLERKHSVTKVTNKETETKTIGESKEVKTNGAIPKKPNNSVVITTSSHQQQSKNNDLSIKETNNVREDEEEYKMSQKPIPLKRQSKPETEVGHVECIHVHVESPRSTPRLDHTSGVTSFKTETNETNEMITTKTPFILTSPPTQRRTAQPKVNQDDSSLAIKETVKIIQDPNRNERINELNIKEERINVKSEAVTVKPALSPKPVTEPNGKLSAFAEIHKPMRSKITTNSQNGHIRRASRDEIIITPPMIPIQKSKEDKAADLKIEKKLINSESSQNHFTAEKKLESKEELDNKMEVKRIDNLQIVETSTSVSNTKEEHKVNNNNSEVRREVVDNFEFESLYRPKPNNHMEWKRSTLAPLETHIPPEKRKSVKDIIESINRSQRLLHAAANKDFTVITSAAPENTSASNPVEASNNNNLDENLKILDESEREFQRLVDELEPTTSNGNVTTGAAATSTSSSPTSNCNEEYLEAQKLDNDIFQKCKVKKEVYDYRESSPITSNLDWNPVPKPKRTKPLHE